MAEYKNQDIGSYDDKSQEYVSIWYDEAIVTGFSFHSVMQQSAPHVFHRLFGISVEARHVFAACYAFHSQPETAVGPGGNKMFVTRVWLPDGKTEEFRLGNKYGPPIARMTRTGYIQPERQ